MAIIQLPAIRIEGWLTFEGKPTTSTELTDVFYLFYILYRRTIHTTKSRRIHRSVFWWETNARYAVNILIR